MLHVDFNKDRLHVLSNLGIDECVSEEEAEKLK